MKKKLFTLLITFIHKQSFAAAVAAGTAAGTRVGYLTAIAGLSPAIWVAATFGCIYVYLHHKDTPRVRILNIPLSIFLGVGGGNASASYVRAAYQVDSVFLEAFLALVIAMSWPWVIEKFLGKKPQDEKAIK
jgi:hypothetical protein